MNQKTLALLVGVTVLLGGLYYATIPVDRRAAVFEPRRLFDDVDGQRVERIRIDQGDQSLELAQKEGVWYVPSRGDFPADSAKVRSLLVKLFELTVSQKLPSSSASPDKLGVSDEALKRGSSKVTLLDGKGSPVAGLRIGDARKGTRGSLGGGSGAGQYVRREGQPDIYLIPAPLSVSVSPGYWLDTNLVNVLPGSLLSVQATRETEGMSKVEFELSAAGSSVPGETPKFELAGGVPAGKALQEGAVAQARSALENMRFTDVSPKDAPEVKDLHYDWVNTFRLNNGLVYRVESAQKEDKYFARVSVSLDNDLVARLKKEKEEADRAAQASASPTPSPTNVPAASPSPAPSPAAAASPADSPAPSSPSPSPTPAPRAKKTIAPATQEEVDALSKKLSPWVFELPAYQGKKLRQTMDDLAKAPSATPAAGAPDDLPAPMDQAIPPEEFGGAEEDAPPAE